MCIVYHVKIMCRKRGDHIRTDIDPKKCNKANKRERRLKRYKDGGEQREIFVAQNDYPNVASVIWTQSCIMFE
ncbi:Uncharacterized protein HZ326_8304 [Fusarium oxysporum f. sp. albedinis]|nr:Uncharacterized protein HZ326_8304 [Fusarium oxysporum f. sp. albedinis]